MFDGIWFDLRAGIRGLVQRPGFTISVIMILAVGIGANTTLVGVVDGVLLAALPYPNADRIVAIYSRKPVDGIERMLVAMPIARDWQQQSTTLEGIGLVWAPASTTLAGDEGPSRLRTSVVSPEYFALAGASAQLGRLFGEQDDRIQGEHAVVILSHALWQDRFGADPGIIGQAVLLNGTPYSVVGVLEPGFTDILTPTQTIDIWVPAMMGASILRTNVAEERTTRIFGIVGRLREGASLAQAQGEMDAISGRLAAAYPLSDDGWGAEIVPLRELLFGPFEAPLLSLLAGAALLLTVACANVAGLLLVRASGRSRELSTRLALGASRGRVARLLVIEALVLVLAGGVIGILVAASGTETLARLSPIELPGLAQWQLDGDVFAASLAITLLVGIAAAAGPLLVLRDGSPGGSLGGSGKGASVDGVSPVGRILVVAEVAIAATLLVGAGLTVRSLDRLQRADLGYDPDGFLALQLEASDDALGEHELRTLSRNLIRETLAVAGVSESYIWSPHVPGQSYWFTAVRPQDQPTLGDDELPLVRFHYVTPGALEGLGLRFVAGRGISERDQEGDAGAIVVSESVAETLWPGQDPIGRILRRWNRDQWLTVVGVVAAAKMGGREGNEASISRDVYFSFMQEPQSEMVLLARASVDAAAVAGEVRQAVQDVAADFPVFDLETMTSRMATQEAVRRFTAVLSVTYGTVALLLATIGLYGVLAYSVRTRTREIGLRMALGAGPATTLRQVLGGGLMLTLIGLVIGLASSFALTRFLGALLYDTSPTDLATYAGVSWLLLMSATGACFVPARRAGRLDPIVALRTL